jgi:hypothetical protein
MTGWLDSSAVKLVSFVSAILGIVGFFLIRRKVIRNRVSNSEIGGDFTGYKTKMLNDAVVKNDVENSKIKGNFTGSSE